jgi:hypothetical protein
MLAPFLLSVVAIVCAAAYLLLLGERPSLGFIAALALVGVSTFSLGREMSWFIESASEFSRECEQGGDIAKPLKLGLLRGALPECVDKDGFPKRQFLAETYLYRLRPSAD